MRRLPYSAVSGLLVVAAVAVCGPVTVAAQSPPGATAAQAAWQLSAQDTFRLESWQFFEPNPGGGDPDYTFGANRLLLQARRMWPRVDVRLAAQHVGLIGLPRNASGPGALGTGPIYFDQGGRRRHPQQLYVRYASARFKNVLPGFSVEVGRQGFTSGAEAPSSDAGIEAVKRQRLDARLVGEFEWSLYQRSFDGVRADVSRGSVRATGVAFMPTQGGFARQSGRTMTDLVVAGAAVDVLPSARRRHTLLQGFAWRYDDRRMVTGRPDNSGRTATRADVDVSTFGGAIVGAYPRPGGRIDVLGWFAAQTGNWYGEDHRASALAAEAGYQWTGVASVPWLRVGILRASGDQSAGDTSHGTFFPMLPTMRRYSQTTVYSTMNLNDAFVMLTARPRSGLTARLDVHRLSLASAGDRWYAGSGATLSDGGNFGFTGRSSSGQTALGTSFESSLAWVISPRWSINGFAGLIRGGKVVTSLFKGDRLGFFYLENVVRLGQ